jgi:hypothetical protein
MRKPNRAIALPVMALLMTTLVIATAQAQQMGGWPDSQQEAMTRESGNLESRQFAIADGQYRFEIAGKATTPSPFDGGWSFESDIGSDAMLECYIFTNEQPLAQILHLVATTNIAANVAANDGDLDNLTVLAMDAGQIDGAPYVAVQWVYNVGVAPNNVFGMTTAHAASNGALTQVCSHNAVGYRETVRQTFETFVRSTTQPEPTDPPYYAEIKVQRQADRRFGVTRTTYTLDAEGDTLIQTTATALVRGSRNPITPRDETIISWSTPDGLLINAAASTVTASVLTTDLRADLDDNGDWLVSGTFNDTEIEQSIDGTATVISDLGQMQIARNLFSGEQSTATYDAWMPNIDPSRFQRVEISRDDAEIPRQAALTMGPLPFVARFGENGELTYAQLNAGPADIFIERVWWQGKPR